jgi:hypothetical protein
VGKVNRAGEHFTWYGGKNIRAKMEPPSCRQYNAGDFLAIRLEFWDQIIHLDDDGDNRTNPEAPSSGRSRPRIGNENDNGEGEEGTQGGEKWTGKGRGTKDGKGKDKGNGKGNSRGTGIVKQTPG